MASKGGLDKDELISFLVDRMELDADRGWQLPELIQRYVSSGLWIDPQQDPGLIAMATLETGAGSGNLAISPALTDIPLNIVVPPTDRNVCLYWKALVNITTAGQGGVIMNLYEVTEGGSTLREASVTHVSTSDPTTTIQDNQMGFWQLGRATTTRMFAIKANVIREAGSGLNAALFYGIGPNKAVLKAVAE